MREHAFQLFVGNWFQERVLPPAPGLVAWRWTACGFGPWRWHVTSYDIWFAWAFHIFHVCAQEDNLRLARFAINVKIFMVVERLAENDASAKARFMNLLGRRFAGRALRWRSFRAFRGHLKRLAKQNGYVFRIGPEQGPLPWRRLCAGWRKLPGSRHTMDCRAMEWAGLRLFKPHCYPWPSLPGASFWGQGDRSPWVAVQRPHALRWPRMKQGWL